MLKFEVSNHIFMGFLKGSKLYSIFRGKCPVCHRESMYLNRNPFVLAETLKMHERCSHCDTKYKIEPSFFYGAMYVSYPVGIIFGGTAFLLAHYVFNMGLLASFFVIVVTMLVCLPIIMRLSRNIWINFFMHYDEGKAVLQK